MTCSLVLVIDCGCCGDGCEGGCVGVVVVVGLLALVVVVVVVDLRFGVWSSKHTHDRRPRIIFFPRPAPRKGGDNIFTLTLALACSSFL